MTQKNTVDISDLTAKLVDRDMGNPPPSVILLNFLRQHPECEKTMHSNNQRQQLSMMVIGRTSLIMSALINEKIDFEDTAADIEKLLYNFGYNTLDDEFLGVAMFTVNYLAEQARPMLTPKKALAISTAAGILDNFYGTNELLTPDECTTPAILLSYSVFNLSSDEGVSA